MARAFAIRVALLAAASLVSAASGCSGNAPDKAERRIELTVSAAASLTDALKEAGDAYESERSDIQLSYNFGSSGALQRQIEQGAPADLFLSAAQSPMQALADNGLISRHAVWLTNELVAVQPADAPLKLGREADLLQPGIDIVAIGIPESVPAGSYAKQALENAGLWDALQPKTVQAKDVRQVLQYVESGNADIGFVYKTDALTSKKASISFRVDPSLSPAVEYPIGIVSASKHPEQAEDFYRYLQSKKALEIFVKYGFSVPGGS
ncbi:molybdate ABC transporter substrate-binding protein [Paenibacillus thermoaerophilus]|uniref:Molybdate ABC transporter substrate-binding protein n=1 Tax=Paenibacillus thermoaerophilus TaxID=1215385 RepID=A0ABW2V1C2_9BACL|nr:molybdate ABC transporter substrate-binding protein [Paenibacillus thermoaerophilus]TMV10443.1 molybdate ABC transporter substrate-binding protein [Paenibacillus thermoaerophilus]